jgi:hypothetical protein
MSALGAATPKIVQKRKYREISGFLQLDPPVKDFKKLVNCLSVPTAVENGFDMQTIFWRGVSDDPAVGITRLVWASAFDPDACGGNKLYDFSPAHPASFKRLLDYIQDQTSSRLNGSVLFTTHKAPWAANLNRFEHHQLVADNGTIEFF